MTQKLLPCQKVAGATSDQSLGSPESGSLDLSHANFEQGLWDMRKSAAGACALALFGLLAGSASAQQGAETGVASIHSWVKVGRKTCMLDHYHDGSGTGSTRAKAEKSAIVAWTEFTAWEYGSPWARYSNAVSKTMNCSQAGGWTCQIQARPCRPY